MKNYFSILFLFFTFQVFSQNPKVDLSEEMKEPARSTIGDIVGESPDAFYAVRLDADIMKVNLTIERYDKEYHMKVSEELDLEVDDDNLIYETTVLFNGSLYVFGSRFSRKNDVEKLYAFKMDPVSLKIDQTPHLVATIESKHNSKFLFDLSNNEKYLSITSIPGTDDDNIYAYTINVYKDNLEEMWKVQEKNKYDEYTFYAQRGQVDDKGNVYVMAVKYDEPLKGFKAFGKPPYKFLLVAHTENGENENAFPLDLKNRKFISELNFRTMDNGTVVCGGFYSDSYGGGYSGVCFFSLDPKTGNVGAEGTKEFDAKNLSEFMSDRRAKKGKDIYNFDLRDIVLRSDGGLVMIAEYYNVVQHTTTSSTGSTRTTYIYYYNSLLVTSVNPDLTIDWVQSVPKRQVTSNDNGYFSSYTMMVHGEYIYVLFNDNDKNLDNLGEDDKIANFDGKRSVVALVRIAGDGSMKKSLLIENKEEGFILRPKVCEQVSDNEMVVYGELHNHYKVGKVIF